MVNNTEVVVLFEALTWFLIPYPVFNRYRVSSYPRFSSIMQLIKRLCQRKDASGEVWNITLNPSDRARHFHHRVVECRSPYVT